ncbi:MAG: PDZ domain-containing protein [Sedimentisphaerales bacterium]|nr:PDZ domain-containing protein [Sedimentisphaerales bacterium]
MKIKQTLIISTIIVALTSCTKTENKAEVLSTSEKMKNSLVNLRVSVGGYEQFQPWKQREASQQSGYGCAVGPYLILTTSDNVASATMVQTRRYEKNEWIPATIKTIDYEYDLCLLELDPNTAGQPFEPIQFVEQYAQGQEHSIYWLSGGGHLTEARGILDRAQCESNPVSFTDNLYYILTNPSRSTDQAEVVFCQDKAVGIVGFSDDTDLGVIPAEIINRFLKESQEPLYKGFGIPGFLTSALLDPTIRKHLRMPEDMKHGVYVSKVHTLGTGSRELKSGDVILSIDNNSINPYGRYLHTQYDRIDMDYLISQKKPGETLDFLVFRDGSQTHINVEVTNFTTQQMLVPYYEYGKQPSYLVTGGYVFQKLTRNYFALWGDNWSGKVPPHLYQYYSNHAFNPTEERQDIVILSYVLPAPINLGYQELGRLVVSTWNGMKIRSFEDIDKARQLNPDSPFEVIEFELNTPKIVIPRQNIVQYDTQIGQIYGISSLKNI